MMQLVKQTREEKIAMYMKIKKRQLAEMLANRDMYDQDRSNPKVKPSDFRVTTTVIPNMGW